MGMRCKVGGGALVLAVMVGCEPLEGDGRPVEGDGTSLYRGEPSWCDDMASVDDLGDRYRQGQLRTTLSELLARRYEPGEAFIDAQSDDELTGWFSRPDSFPVVFRESRTAVHEGSHLWGFERLTADTYAYRIVDDSLILETLRVDSVGRGIVRRVVRVGGVVDGVVGDGFAFAVSLGHLVTLAVSLGHLVHLAVPLGHLVPLAVPLGCLLALGRGVPGRQGGMSRRQILVAEEGETGGEERVGAVLLRGIAMALPLALEALHQGAEPVVVLLVLQVQLGNLRGVLRGHALDAVLLPLVLELLGDVQRQDLTTPGHDHAHLRRVESPVVAPAALPVRAGQHVLFGDLAGGEVVQHALDRPLEHLHARAVVCAAAVLGELVDDLELRPVVMCVGVTLAHAHRPRRK